MATMPRAIALLGTVLVASEGKVPLHGATQQPAESQVFLGGATQQPAEGQVFLGGATQQPAEPQVFLDGATQQPAESQVFLGGATQQPASSGKAPGIALKDVVPEPTDWDRYWNNGTTCYKHGNTPMECVDSHAVAVAAFVAHVIFFGMLCTIVYLAWTQRKRSREHKQLVARMAAVIERGDGSGLVLSTLPVPYDHNDRMMLTPPACPPTPTKVTLSMA